MGGPFGRAWSRAPLGPGIAGGSWRAPALHPPSRRQRGRLVPPRCAPPPSWCRSATSRSLNSVFAEPKLALLWIAAAVGIAGWIVLPPAPGSQALGRRRWRGRACRAGSASPWARGWPARWSRRWRRARAGRRGLLRRLRDRSTGSPSSGSRSGRRRRRSIRGGGGALGLPRSTSARGLVSLIGILQHLQVLAAVHRREPDLPRLSLPDGRRRRPAGRARVASRRGGRIPGRSPLAARAS